MMKHKKTIFHIIPRIEYGGTERIVTQIMCSKAISAEYRQVLFVLKDDQAENARCLSEAGCDVRFLNIKKGGLGTVTSILNAINTLRKSCRRENPHIIMGWLYYGNIMASFLRPKKATVIHNIRNSGFDASQYKIPLKLARWMNACLSNKVDMTIYNSFAGKSDHVVGGFSSVPSKVIYNGIKTDLFTPSSENRIIWRKTHNIGSSEKIILVVGRNDPQKRYDKVLDIARQFPDHHFFIIGKGVEFLPRESNVTTLEHQKDIHKIYPGADIILSASSFGEGFQNTIAEGMSSGLIPVCHNAGDIKNLIGQAGYVADNYYELTSLLKDALCLSKDDIKKKSAESRQQITTHFSIETFDALFLNMLNKTLNIYNGS
jgi:glycosyltransferase involved in cell wall biosynthesis